MSQSVQHENKKNADSQPEGRSTLIALTGSLKSQEEIKAAEESVGIPKGGPQEKFHPLYRKEHGDNGVGIDIPVLGAERAGSMGNPIIA